MESNTYQQLAARTLLKEPGFEIPGEQNMIIWNALGLMGEAGEVAELIKKGVYHQHGLDKEKLTKELGDVAWYLAALCTSLNIPLSDVMEQNIAKLKLRYPQGFTSGDSVKRVDVATT